MEDDTIKLLRECNAGIKMGISSLEKVMNNVENQNLKMLLKESWNKHCKLEERTHEYLKKYHDQEKEPNIMAKAMSSVKINMKLASEEPDKAAADVIIDGCNMGVKSLYRYLSQYPAAREPVKLLTNEIISEEENLAIDLRRYL